MSATVAAALKKIAVALLSSKKGRKFIKGLIAGVIVLLILPFMVIAFIFGEFDMDTDTEGNVDHWTAVDEYVDEGHANVLEQIESQLEKDEISDRFAEAKVFVLFYLYDYALQNDFVFKLMTCIHEDQTPSELAEEVSEMFGIEIDIAEFEQLIGYYAPPKPPETSETEDLPPEQTN